MIDKELLSKTDIFVVDIKVSPDNDIVVEIDSPDNIDVDTCAAITRRIEEVFDRDTEDYSLEVGSAGLTAPFKVRGQYLKNIGNKVEVLTSDGRKLKGVLTAVADDGRFTVAVPTKVKHEVAKRPVVEDVEHVLDPADCRSVRYNLEF